jgi:hypothetical protein
MKQKYPELYHSNTFSWRLIIAYPNGDQDQYTSYGLYPTLLTSDFAYTGEIK